MNLVTIDNKKIWSKNKKNLLVGSWCIDNEHKYKKDESKKYLISEYHWSNKSKIRKDMKYMYKIYNYLLDNLCLNLNKFHNLKYPKRYWELLLWQWLKLHIYMTYDIWEINRASGYTVFVNGS